jgi:iron complex outermembrane receptor protein
MTSTRLFASCALASGLLLAGVSPVQAQRADENAVADAEDAFGSNLGGEGLGIYGPSDVRGFSPIDSGNVRIEGVYLDRQAELTSRLVEGARIRVGPSALGYAFPAPSGIVDYRLRRPGDSMVVSVSAKAESLGGRLLEVDAIVPLRGESLGLAAGVGLYRNDFASGSTSDVVSGAVVAVWRPAPAIELTPFWSQIRIRDEEAEPVVIGDGSALPPRLKRHRFLGQDWADFEVKRENYGMIGAARIGRFQLRGGVFHSADRTDEGYSILLPAPRDASGLVSPIVVADPFRERASTSGEVSLSRRFETGRLRQDLLVSVRGRRQTRTYGGSASAALPPAPFGQAAPAAQPPFAFGPQTQDVVRQVTAGLAYQATVTDLGLVNLAVQKAGYRKAVTTPSGPLPTSRDEPWLFSGSLLAILNPRLSLYAGRTQGLEESDVAPETAVNRDEAPAAIRTSQFDGGLRWRPVSNLTLVAGAFRIEKPYFGLDAGSVFRQLGEVRHQGLEVSVAGALRPGLTLVAGAVLLDAEVSGDEVQAGRIGKRPVGVPESTLSASLDWRPAAWDRLSLDAALEHKGAQYADAANRVRIPAHTTLDLGARYRLSLAGSPATLRLQVTNLLDTYAWTSVASNAFTYAEPRKLHARLTVDF